VKRLTVKRFSSQLLCAVLAGGAFAVPAAYAKTSKKITNPAELRTDYIARLQEQPITASMHTVGSLWSLGDTSDLSSDYKARKLNDTVVILVSVQNSARAFGTSSAITGLAGDINTKGLNPLFNANSNTTLKGSGSTDSSTAFSTSMTAQVIAVLPSGNLVVEAQRKIFMNNQHEDVTIRGVVRPNDIGPSNTVPSTALSNLEIEMKGKGIIADSTRPPNRITRAILWLLGF
jgi:flagellar L-ring protein precursor FlgH